MLLMLALLLPVIGFGPDTVYAQTNQAPTLWGPATWFDWSDFRGIVGGRIYMPHLVSGTRELAGEALDLKDDLGFRDAPEPFHEIIVGFYLDRLGIRYHMDETTRFYGLADRGDERTHSDIELRSPRLGVDLDLIRTSFLRLGANYDWYTRRMYFRDRSTPGQLIAFEGNQPMTIGAHGTAIPFRVKGVPFIIHGRIDFPFPIADRSRETRLTTWEAGGGLRPPIWETSLLAHTTFSAGFEVGFRQVKLEYTNDRESFQLDAVWQGPYFQMAIYY